LALLFLARDHSAAPAGGAFVLGDKVEPPLRALDRIDERDSDFGAKIGGARRRGARAAAGEIEAEKSACRPAAAAPAGAASEAAWSAAAEELRKEIAE